MAWLEQTYMNGQHKYWTDTDTGEIVYSRPSGGQIVTEAPQATWTESKYMDGQHSAYTNDKTGEVVYNKDATLTDAERQQQFMDLWNNPNASSWDKAQGVQKQYGIETLAQLVNQGQFSDVPDIGAYVAARQREANDAGFTVGGNKLGLWPVAAGMAVGGLLGSAGAGAGGGAAAGEGAAAGATAAEGAGAVSAGAGGFEGAAIGAGDMFGSGVVYDAGVAGLGGAGASTTGGVLAGSGDMFGSGAAWDAGTAGLQTGAAAPAGGAAAAATGGGAATEGGLLGSGASGLLSSPQVLGMGAGALLGAMGGGGEAETVETEEGLPDWLMPYAKPALDQYSTQIQNLNTDPYGIMPSAMKEFKSTIDGQYLDPSTNKYLEDYYKLGAERIKGSLQPSFGHMQAFGSHSGYNEALSRGLGDFATGLYGGNYSKERDRQTAMTSAAPQFLAQSSTAQTLPYQQYLQSISGLGKKKEDPFFTNPMGGILGGAMVGSQLGSLWK